MLYPYAVSCTPTSQSNAAGYDNIRSIQSDLKASHDKDECEIYNDFVKKCKLYFMQQLAPFLTLCLVRVQSLQRTSEESFSHSQNTFMSEMTIP